MWALGEIATKQARSVVETALNDESPDVRIAAVSALESRALEALLPLVRDENHRVRHLVARRLGESRDASRIEPLLVLLHDPAASIRTEAAISLGRIESSRAVDELIVRLRDPDPTVRSAAHWALDEIRS